MSETCAEAGCGAAAGFEFYDPRTGEVRLLCDEHLEGADEMLGIRSWLLAGYAVPVGDEQFRGELPRAPRNEEEQRARQSIDRLVRGDSPGGRR